MPAPTCGWRDQGWGERVGRIFLAGRPRSPKINDLSPRFATTDPEDSKNDLDDRNLASASAEDTWENESVVWQSPLAPHKKNLPKFISEKEEGYSCKIQEA